MPAPRRTQLLPALLLAGLALLPLAPAQGSEEQPLRVAVAANFRAAAEILGELFTREHGAHAVFSSASTGVLAAQLRSGAPFDVLLAADAARPAALHRGGFALAPPRCYAVGALVLLGADDADAALADPGRSVAIANPATAPYGVAAQAILAQPRFAGARERRVLRAANVMQAYQFFRSGGADLALVARSIAPGSGAPIPAAWHPPIRQFALISARSAQPELARAFLDTITGAAAADILAERGYTPCS